MNILRLSIRLKSLVVAALLAGMLGGFGCSDDPEADPCAPGSHPQLRVYSNNVGIFPAYMVANYSDELKKKKAKLVADEEERAKQYAQVLLDWNEDPDLILLQEIWSVKARNVLNAQLASKWPHVAHPPAAFDALQPSGLMMFSKTALADFQFEEFEAGEGFDKVSQKGVAGATVTVSGKQIAAFVTHMQAGGKDKTIRPQQMQQMDTFIAKYRESHKDALVIVAGDFNTKSNTDAYQQIFDNLPTAKDTFDSACSSLQKTGRYDDDPTKRIDYLLTIDGAEARSVIVDPAGETLADHLAIFGRVTL